MTKSAELRQFTNYITVDENTGDISLSADLTTTGTITGGVFSGDGAGLIEVNAATLDGLDSTQFLRSDQTSEIDGGLYLGGDLYRNGGTTDNFAISQGTSTQNPSVAFWAPDDSAWPGQVHIVSNSTNSSANSGKIIFWDFTGSSFNPNVTIDKNGYVGIANGSPSTYLDIKGPHEGIYIERNAPSSSGSHLRLRKSRDGGSVQDGDRVGYVTFEPLTASGYVEATGIFGEVKGAVSSGNAPTDLVFIAGNTGYAGNNEKMRLVSSGRLGIGTSTPTTGGAVSKTPFLHIYNNTSGVNPTLVVSCENNDEASLYLAENSGDLGYGARLYYEGSGNYFFNIKMVDLGVETTTPAFSIHRNSNVLIPGALTVQGGVYGAFKEYNTTAQFTLAGGNSSYTWSPSLPANTWVALSIFVSSTASDQSDHYDIKVGPNADYGYSWGDTYPSSIVPYGFGIVTHPGDNQGVAMGHYGMWDEIIAKTNSSGQLVFSIVGSDGGSGVAVRTKGYWLP
jgi:hypothetical protein